MQVIKMTHKVHLYNSASAVKTSRIVSGFAKSKSAAQLLWRAAIHPRIFFRHFSDHANLIEKATLEAKWSDETVKGLIIENYRLADRRVKSGGLVAELKEEFGKVNTGHFTAYALLDPKSVPIIREKIDELEKLQSG